MAGWTLYGRGGVVWAPSGVGTAGAPPVTHGVRRGWLLYGRGAGPIVWRTHREAASTPPTTTTDTGGVSRRAMMLRAKAREQMLDQDDRDIEDILVAFLAIERLM